ncbi:hypothetical protein [Sabulicella rubraurantiaca]|uniref:hypothetical protein n=1 Tax=Sabulicella rubraurantiaca TaxID=2811429 RepID=UPI001A956FE5|nr:hypothetical protein [Sabulicella rubraurantiaca]
MTEAPKGSFDLRINYGGSYFDAEGNIQVRSWRIDEAVRLLGFSLLFPSDSEGLSQSDQSLHQGGQDGLPGSSPFGDAGFPPYAGGSYGVGLEAVPPSPGQTTIAVPAPEGFAFLALGLLGLGFVRRGQAAA